MPYDIEASIVAWIAANTGWDAATEVPNPRPERFVSIERTGGGVTGIVLDNPTVAIQCWAPTRAEAAEMAYSIRDMLPSFKYEANVRAVLINSIASFPAPDSPRYQIVADIKTV